MSGQKFVEALLRLGYPRATQLDGGSFDWIFEYDSVVPFLEWFCDEVQANNRLDPKDIAEFKALEQSPEGILEGDQLEDAVQSLTAGEDDDFTDEGLRQDIEQLEDDLKSCQHRKDLLIQQRNKLCQHKTGLSERLSKLDKVANGTKTQYKMNLEQSQADNVKVNTALENLVSAVSKLNHLYEETTSGIGEQLMEPKIPVFLSQMNMDNLFKLEEKFTMELTAFTKKQFFEGIAEMVESNEGSRYNFLEISNPDSLLVSGEKESIVYEACKEIARLQIHYPKSETLRINAIVEEKTANVTCDFTDQKYQQLKQKPYPISVTDLSNRLKDAQTTLSILRRDLLTMAEEDIPSLIKDSATLQVTWILRGNYDLKIARQDYFMSNQEQLIEQLLIQKARFEFLTMAFELEAKTHRDTYRLLTAINMLLQKAAKSQQDRLEMLKDPLLSSSRNQRSTLDSRDKFFTKLHQLLDPNGFSSQPQLFITYNQLAENGDKLNLNLTALRASYSTANNSQDDRVHMLEKSVKSCESTLYSGSSTLGGQPTLSPQPIVDMLTHLDGMLKQLERSVMDILKDVEYKKKSLHSDPLLVTERELFVNFFNDPDRLRRVMMDISRKLDAHLVT